MHFKRSVQRYGRTPEPETPFQRAGQLWDERIGSARVQAGNWRLIAFGALAVTAGMSGALAWQSTQSRVTPYVVEVDKLGEARAISEADKAFTPSDPQIAWHLAKFVENVRTVSLDPVLMRRNWLAAYDFATQRGAVFLNEYARSADPFASLGDKAVSVEVTSVVRASDRSFQIKWVETAYSRGAVTARAHWTGILTVVLKPPANADVLRKNPLGLYVDAVDWSREVEPATTPTPVAAPVPAAPQPVPLGSPLDPNLTSTPTLSLENRQ
jgi:type IV secretory pathway TrbF-like protein